jgi:hypothetical protein
MRVARSSTVRLAASWLGGAAIAVTAACGGDSGPMSAAAYFERLNELDDARASALADLNNDLEALSPDDVEGAMDILDRQTDARETFVDGLDGLEPPDDVRALHEEALRSHREEAEAYRAFLAGAEDAASLGDLLALLPDFDADAVGDAQASCRALEQYAATAAITVDLACGQP